MKNELTQEELDSHYGYIYNIVGPGGRIYVGKHQHTIGESWFDYTGSGLRMKDEQAFFEPDMFIDPKVRIEHLERKPGTRLRHYRKYLSSFADNRTDLDAKELHSIDALVRSGKPFYNMEDADNFATTYEARLSSLAFRLSFEPRVLEDLPAQLVALSVAHHPLTFGALDLIHDAITEGRRIRSQRHLFRNNRELRLNF